MKGVDVNFISNLFLISGAILFISALILVILKHKEKTAYIIPQQATFKRKEKKPKNRRKLERLNYSNKIRFGHPEPPYEEGTATARNITPGGVGLLVPVNIKVRSGAKIDLEFFLKSKERSVRITGEIVWAESLEDDEMEKLSFISEFFTRQVGVKFTEQDKEEKQAMEGFLEGLSEEKKDLAEHINE